MLFEECYIRVSFATLCTQRQIPLLQVLLACARKLVVLPISYVIIRTYFSPPTSPRLIAIGKLTFSSPTNWLRFEGCYTQLQRVTGDDRGVW